MLRDLLWEKSSIEYVDILVIRDRDSIWRKSGLTEKAVALGYQCYSAADSIELRYAYEKHAVLDGEKCILLYDGDFIPYDIRRRATVFDASFENVFPTLDADMLRSFPNINIDLLSVASRDVFTLLGKDDTEDFCCGQIWKPEYVSRLANEYRNECDVLLHATITKDTWVHISQMLGFIQTAGRIAPLNDDLQPWYDDVTNQFAQWLKSDYRYLSGTPTKKQPYLLSQVLDYARRNNSGKIALVVMDGMSFADFHTVRRDLARLDLKMDVKGVYSFLPSITSVSRQSLFSGKLPVEHDKPFELVNEEKQFRDYWISNGIKEKEICFAKTEEPTWEANTKVIGIVINIVDDLMHSELQGEKGMYTGLSTWLESGNLSILLRRLNEDGFTVYLTADHGNTAAIAQGRFSKPTVITENASRRAVIYQSFAGAEELDKFDTIEYTCPYLPKGYRYFSFAQHTCYGNNGTEYISHGGMTIEEVVVPFVRIGE